MRAKLLPPHFITLTSQPNEYVPAGMLKDTLGARFNKQTKVWSLPFSYSNLQGLARADLGGLGDDRAAIEYLTRKTGFQLEVEPDDHLKPFQLEAEAFLRCSPFPGSILALSPGLGKTVVSLRAIEHCKFNSALVVAPLSLLGNWYRESKRFSSHDFDVSHGRGPANDFAITNYETVVNRLEFYRRHWDVIILDESILVKNRKTKRQQAMKALRTYAGKIWCLSGSPVSRGIEDIWAQFNLIYPSAFSSYWRFVLRYCHVQQTTWGGWEILGPRQDVDVKSDHRDLLYVRSIDEVIELPQFVYETIQVDLTPKQNEVYVDALKDFLIKLEDGSIETIPARIAQIVRLQQIVSNPAVFSGEDESGKLNTLLDMIETKAFETPAIIWTHWVPGALRMYEKLASSFPRRRIDMATGETKNVDAVIQRFQGGATDILIISMGVGKYGHTLTKAKTEIYFDQTFDMDAYVQSLHRVRRIGLDHSVSVIRLICPGTVDDLVADNLAGKARPVSDLSNIELAQLLRGVGR